MKRGNDIFIDDDSLIKDLNNAILGTRVAIDKGFYCSTKLNIGDYVHIGPHVSIVGSTKGLFICKGFNNIMAGARIICGSDRFDDSGLFGAMIPKEYKGNQIIEPVIMEEFSNIGTNAVVLPGSILRKGVLLTIGSVLFGDTVEWGVYKGNPAKLVKIIDGTRAIENAKKLGYEF